MPAGSSGEKTEVRVHKSIELQVPAGTSSNTNKLVVWLHPLRDLF